MTLAERDGTTQVKGGNCDSVESVRRSYCGAAGEAVMTRLPPTGYWCHAPKDSELFGQQLGLLRELIESELELQYGRRNMNPVERVNIVAHEKSDGGIPITLTESTVLIPIITPNFVQSEWCCEQLDLFLQREKMLWSLYPDLEGRSLIFPINYKKIQEDASSGVSMVDSLRPRHWLHFRHLRESDLSSEIVSRAIGEFADAICDTLSREVEALPLSAIKSAAHAKIVVALAPAAMEGVKALLKEQGRRLHNDPPEAVEEADLQALRELHGALGRLIQAAGSGEDFNKHVEIVRSLRDRVFGFAADTGELCVAGFKPLLASIPAAWGTWTLLGLICTPDTFASLGPTAAVAVAAGYFGLELKSRRGKKAP